MIVLRGSTMIKKIKIKLLCLKCSQKKDPKTKPNARAIAIFAHAATVRHGSRKILSKNSTAINI